MQTVNKLKRLNKSTFLIISLFLMVVIHLFSSDTFAARLTSVSVNLSRINESIASVHTIRFVATSGVSAGGDITINLPVGFNIGLLYDFNDVALAEGNSSNCDTATWTPKTLAAAPSGAIWGFSVVGQNLIFTSGTDTIPANRCVRIIFNDNGLNHQIVNPNVIADQVFNINISTGSNSDSSQAAVIILNDPSTPDGDQVSIVGNLLTSIFFDLDTVSVNCVNSTETALSQVSLGTLFPGILKTSGVDVNYICVDVGTNASNGVSVYVRSNRNNTVGGLVNGFDVIPSSTSNLNLVSVTQGYGLRVSSLGVPDFGSFVSFSPFNSATPGDVGLIPGLLSSHALLFKSNAPARTGSSNRIALEIGAKVGSAQAGGLYSDILSFYTFVNL